MRYVFEISELGCHMFPKPNVVNRKPFLLLKHHPSTIMVAGCNSCWLLLIVTAVLQQSPVCSEPLQDADLVFACVTHQAGVPIAQASRAWRGGVRAHYILDDALGLADIRQGTEQYHETYSAHHDAPYYRKVQEFRFAMGPLIAHKSFGETYKWLMYGDDDTIFLTPAVKALLQKYDPELPYFITDNFWSNLEPGTNDLFEAVNPSRVVSRCLPCHWKGFKGDEVEPTIQAVPGCPCTPELACADINLPIKTSWSKAGCLEQSFRYHAFGGTGVIFSVGLLKALARRELEYQECVYMVRWEFGDRVLTSCLFHMGFAPTDPGLFLNDPNRPPLFGSLNNRNLGLTAHELETRINAVELGRVSQTEVAVLLEMVSIHVKSAKSVHGMGGAAEEMVKLSKLFDRLDKLRGQMDLLQWMQ